MMKKERQEKIVLMLSIVLALFTGLFIYVVFRQDTYVAKALLKIMNLRPFELNSTTTHIPSWCLNFIRNFACDMLWAYALTVALFLLIGTDRHGVNKTFTICVLFEVFMEYLQKIKVFSGTFDIVDIILEVVVSAAALLLIKFKRDEGMK